ncbi:hypothetical protein [Nonomuraea typhae]|uniref:Uncharacterized protein n=1 Tax=Nonomuraea typhae TaxID=2603600 RepID=A0ABW7YJ40_9ACTN
MQKGDISSEIVPRILIEFEGLLAHPQEQVPEPGGFLDRVFVRVKKPKIAWDLDDLVVKVMWDLTWRFSQEIDVITKQGEVFARDLADRLEVEQVPARRIWDYQPRRLARQLASMPYIAAVYTGEREHAMLYGSRGRLVTPATITQIGRF